MVSAKLFIEGGGDRKSLKRECRAGFGKFIERAGLRGKKPRIVASGSRNKAYEDFLTAHARGDATAMLLVDAESPVATRTAWEHLQRRDGWSRPAGATDDQCHLMVQVMESWFLSDPDALERFYDQGFRKGALPGNPNNTESVPKGDVENGLSRSTASARKGRYHKGRHSFKILATIDPGKVMAASSHAANFISALRSM